MAFFRAISEACPHQRRGCRRRHCNPQLLCHRHRGGIDEMEWMRWSPCAEPLRTGASPRPEGRPSHLFGATGAGSALCKLNDYLLALGVQLLDPEVSSCKTSSALFCFPVVSSIASFPCLSLIALFSSSLEAGHRGIYLAYAHQGNLEIQWPITKP